MTPEEQAEEERLHIAESDQLVIPCTVGVLRLLAERAGVDFVFTDGVATFTERPTE